MKSIFLVLVFTVSAFAFPVKDEPCFQPGCGYVAEDNPPCNQPGCGGKGRTKDTFDEIEIVKDEPCFQPGCGYVAEDNPPCHQPGCGGKGRTKPDGAL